MNPEDKKLAPFMIEAFKRDQLGGWHPDAALRKWPVGSCFETEGRYLYANVRMLRPRAIVEIGRWEGCSAAHLALALKHNALDKPGAGESGKVFSLDIAAGMGSKIPAELMPWVELLNADATSDAGLDLLTRFAPQIDFLLEDGAHTTGFTENILTRYGPRVKTPGGAIIVHDYCHWDCQATVAADCRKILGDPDEIFLQPPSDCGYAVYRKC